MGRGFRDAASGVLLHSDDRPLYSHLCAVNGSPQLLCTWHSAILRQGQSLSPSTLVCSDLGREPVWGCLFVRCPDCRLEKSRSWYYRPSKGFTNVCVTPAFCVAINRNDLLFRWLLEILEWWRRLGFEREPQVRHVSKVD